MYSQVLNEQELKKFKLIAVEKAFYLESSQRIYKQHF